MSTFNDNQNQNQRQYHNKHQREQEHSPIIGKHRHVVSVTSCSRSMGTMRQVGHCAANNKGPQCTYLPSRGLICILLIAYIQSISQFTHCQTTATRTTNEISPSHHHQRHQPTAESDVAIASRCDHSKHQPVSLSSSNSNNNNNVGRNQQSAHQFTSAQYHARQQRQFNQRAKAAPLMLDNQNQNASPEEFSLGPTTSSLPTTQTATPSGTTITTVDPSHTNGTGYSLSGTDSQHQTQNSAKLNDDTSSASQPQTPPTRTSSSYSSLASQKESSDQPAITTPTLANDPIGSPPVVPQPLATTSPSLSGLATTAQQTGEVGASQPATNLALNATPTSATTTTTTTSTSNNRQQASGRKVDDASYSDRYFAAASLQGDHHQQMGPNEPDHTQQAQHQNQQQFSGGRHFHSTAPNAISSSPSSISIITPLNAAPGHQQQQQQQADSMQQSQSAMMKPIFVLGNPINEPDLLGQPTSTQMSFDSSKQSTSVNDIPLAKASKSVDSTMQQQLQRGRSEKRAESPDSIGHMLLNQMENPNLNTNQTSANNLAAGQQAPIDDRMTGPALVYSDGHLSSVVPAQQAQQSTPPATNPNATVGLTTSASNQDAPILQPLSPRLYQAPASSPGGAPSAGAAVLGNNPRRPSLPPPVNQANAASGFRSPMSPSGPLLDRPQAGQQQQQQQPQPSLVALQPPVNSLGMGPQPAMMPNFYQTSPPYAGAGQLFAGSAASQALQQQTPHLAALSAGAGGLNNKQAMVLQQQQQLQQIAATGALQQAGGGTTSGQGQAIATQTSGYSSRRPLNITRVEHISAECSNDLIRAVIVFNGTFKGIIYSSGYVNDPTCLYVNGTGSTRYEFSIRLNQCGTLGRQELHQPTIPGEARRRDQVMWNTLSIQYNPVIEQEWDEHFRVSCEYGSDFWKTVSFSPFNVETNTGSPVVFTINPPQCQMDVLLGHGMGPKIAVDGPVTVGDPLTLLIHMKSEKAGYDILVKNCVAHNGGKQRMQLIDSNGCVVNERFISPFRGTYNDNDLRHVTLYAYLKAFRFTGSPVLYLECEIHMCQSACPPQMCYWRRLSKRSVDNTDFEYNDDQQLASNSSNNNPESAPLISDSLSLFKALQVRHEPSEPTKAKQRASRMQEIYAEDDEAQLVCYRHAEVMVFMATIAALFILVLTIAMTCCWRIRKLTRSQFCHNRLNPQLSGSGWIVRP